jgi:hypothetical protein
VHSRRPKHNNVRNGEAFILRILGQTTSTGKSELELFRVSEL